MWAGNFHHVLILVLVVYNFMNSECEDSYPLIFFFDDVCFYNIDRNCVRTALITCGYLTYDFLLLTLFFTKERPITYQTIAHHIIAYTTLMLGFHTGYSMGTLATMTLVCEISSVFLNYRSIFIERKIKNTLAFANQVVFFLTFTLTRIIMLPCISYLVLVFLKSIWDDIGLSRKIAGIIMFSSSCMMLLLNFYWFHLIIKGMIKTLKERKEP